MKTIKTAEAEGPALDWLVAKCEGVVLLDPHNNKWELCWTLLGDNSGDYYSPTTDWAQGGPIIEREGVNLSIDYQDDALSNDMVQLGWKGNLWNNSVPGTPGFLQWSYGPTPLIAAMRCFCCSKLGETVEVPEELT